MKANKKAVTEKTDEKDNRSLKLSVKEGVLQSVSGSIFSTFIVPLALALKATNFQVGLIATAQQVAHTAGQIPGAKLTAYFDRKTIWLICQLIGRIAVWIPIILLPYLNLGDPVTFLIILATFSSFVLSLRSSAWTSLMGDLVRTEIRGRYFGTRNMLIGAAGIAATIVAGFVVSSFGFPIIFVIGLGASILAIYFFMKIYEPPTKRIFHYKHELGLRPRDWLASIKFNMGLAMFTLYSTMFNFAVEMAAPFYTVYMLKDLGFSYELFSLLIIAGAVARLVSFRYWGRLNDRFGSRKILVITGILGCFTPLGWMLSSTALHVLIVRIYDGLIFAGIDQVVFNYLLDATPANKRPQYVANYNFFVGIGIVFGTMTGAFLAQSLIGSTFFWLTGLQILFFASFVLRAAASALLTQIREIGIKQTEIMPLRYVFWRTVAVEPASGLKNAIQFTFRYTYDREAEYVKAIRKRKQHDEIVKGM